MKKILINLIVLCLIFSVHVPLTHAEVGIDSESLDVIKGNLVDELENAGIQNVEVELLTPMQVETQNLESDIKEIYEEKFEESTGKTLEEVINQKNEETDIDIEHLKTVQKSTTKFTEEDIEEFEELLFDAEEEEGDIKYIEEIKENLNFENEEAKDNLVDSNDVIVQIKGENESDEEFVLGFGFEIGNNIINVFTETDLGEFTEYQISLDALTDDSLTANIKNLETEEVLKVEYNDDEFTTSAFWIPALGVAVTVSMIEALAISVGVATLIYLAAQGLLSLKAGALWVAGKIANNNTKNKRYVHYEAMRTSNSVGIWVGPGRSKKKAISRLKSGLDTWSIGATNARLIAKGASPTGRYRFDKPHSAGKGKRTFAHYHPYEYGSHSFYGGGKLW